MSFARRLPVLLILLLASGAVSLAVLLLRGSDHQVAACPSGYVPVTGEQLRELRERMIGASAEEAEERAEGQKRDRGPGLCRKRGARIPESFGELSRVSTSTTQRLGADRPGAVAAAVQAKRALTGTSVPGTAGSWTPVGKGPLRADDTSYPSAAAAGVAKIGGRTVDFAYDPVGKQLFAAVANGGVWRSTDLAAHWTSIGESLPVQTVGAVAWTPAAGGTVIALTGDNAFGGNTYAGVGAYWSTDTGKTWHHAKGIPDGAMGFRVAVHPDRREIVYAATGFGLFRSTDAGRSFVNVALPTGECAGDSKKPGCFLANVVTDVVVQGADRFGHDGGAVLAAVGWRSGAQRNADGTVQAPANGLYSSPTGAPGTFKKLQPPGFTPQDRIGRVALGLADGPAQNHAYVYALVQDAQLFRTGKIEGLDVAPVPNPLDPKHDLTGTPTYLNGVYVSPDFGRSWRLMSSGEQFLLPTSGSALAVTVPLGFGPGIQAWFNTVIQPDPTAQAGGVPTRLVLGLEEFFESASVGAPQSGPTLFRAVGPYTAGGPLCILVVAGDVCTTRQQLRPGDTTTHPDNHAALFVPDGSGGATLVVGNDGGVYTQKVPRSGLLTPAGFGPGANEGFNTLVPYGVARAKDGTTYAGLQDSGQIKITPDGRQVATYGGDGTFTLVDPDNADIVLESTPNAGLNRSLDGGHNWENVAPPMIRDASFLAPMVMDPADKKRVAVAGRNVFLTDVGLAGLTPEAWNEVYDLGTRDHPGDRAAESSKTDPANVANAMAIRGKTAYVGYCGSCDPVRDNTRFGSGVATNVDGDWRIVGARGLPKRVINSITIDPSDVRTVYVALGSSTVRPYAPPRALGDDGVDPAGGFVYKSTDGGETFTDITGNLPKIGATWLLVRNGQLLAATTVGVFASRTLAGKEWGMLGTDLPPAPVFSMTPDPGDSGRLIVASLGRGVWSYRFADPCRDRARPRSRISARSARAARAGRKLRLRGKASDRGCGRIRGRVKRVSVSVARVTGSRGTRCRYLQRTGRLSRRALSCRRPRYLRARGTKTWRFTSRRSLPAGRYVMRVRATDVAGNVERPSRSNRVRLRLR